MKKHTLRCTLILLCCLSCSNVTRQSDQVRLTRRAEAFPIAQGSYLQLPFAQRENIADAYFIAGGGDTYCVFVQANKTAGNSSIFVSRSATLADWEVPRLVTTRDGDLMIRHLALEVKHGNLTIVLAAPSGDDDSIWAYRGRIGYEWVLVNNKKFYQRFEETTSLTQGREFSITRSSHYELEVDSLQNLFVMDWLNNRRYFTGLSRLGVKQFLLVDIDANIYIAHNNRQSLALSYFEKGPGLIKLDVAKLKADSDGDGVQDIREHYFGQNPHERDTDADGLLDGVDSDPLADNRKLHSRDDFVRQAALMFAMPEEILQDSTAVINVVTGDGNVQWFMNHRCRILSNSFLPTDNLHMTLPEFIGPDEAEIEIAYRGPLSTSHGFTLRLKMTAAQWQVTALERNWSE